MSFNLKKPIVFFDLEATGLNVLKDRIVQIACIKYLPGQEAPVEMEMLINPGIPIAQEAIDVHGITPDQLRNKPNFTQVAREIYEFIGEADLSGYNLQRFDIPMLMEEFNRAGINFTIDQRSIVDVQQIFYKMEPRTLAAAHKYYCGKPMENAHDALADVKATINVLASQIKHYENVSYEDRDGIIHEDAIQNDIKKLAAFTTNPNSVDVTNRLKYNKEGEIVFNFGKYTGQAIIPVFTKDPQYYNWIMTKDFSIQLKQIIAKTMKEHEQKNNN